MQQFARLHLYAHTFQHMTIAAPPVDSFDANTGSRDTHGR
jgi:hypothetical protein